MSGCGEGAEWVEQLRAPRQGHCTSQSQPVKATLLRRAVTPFVTIPRRLRRQNGFIWYYLVHDNFFVSGLDHGDHYSLDGTKLVSPIEILKAGKCNTKNVPVFSKGFLTAFISDAAVSGKQFSPDTWVFASVFCSLTMYLRTLARWPLVVRFLWWTFITFKYLLIVRLMLCASQAHI